MGCLLGFAVPDDDDLYTIPHSLTKPESEDAGVGDNRMIG